MVASRGPLVIFPLFVSKRRTPEQSYAPDFSLFATKPDLFSPRSALLQRAIETIVAFTALRRRQRAYVRATRTTDLCGRYMNDFCAERHHPHGVSTDRLYSPAQQPLKCSLFGIERISASKYVCTRSSGSLGCVEAVLMVELPKIANRCARSYPGPKLAAYRHNTSSVCA